MPGKLADRCGFFSNEPVLAHQLPTIAIDGPFGTSRSHAALAHALMSMQRGFLPL